VNIDDTLNLYCFRYLKSNYGITTEAVPKMAVVNVELTDIFSTSCIIQEIHMFVMDVSKLKKFTQTNGRFLN